ncbi:(Fe-S)-binding protein [Thioalkalivibrio sp.]|uniref:(Fe-S)-binding protein n=1 Tax=Thioalkalivibrio sp. TaxID=2093813 RepID=UPI003568D25D
MLCGMCLPHCPTYGVQRVEGDSPRGRITLMQGLAQGRLPPENARLRAHLEGCLGCRSCEAVCPAGVRFGELMDHGRHVLHTHPASRWQRLRELLIGPLRRAALRRPGLRRGTALAARLARGSGLARLLPPSLLPGRMLRHVAPSLQRLPALRPSAAPAAADVWLFTGCMDAFFTGPDLRAALELLDGLGVRVAIPRGQACCGAIDQHLGRLGDAEALRTSNLRAFAGEQRVLVLDSGCEAQLREYPAEGWQGRVTSLTGFLADLPVEEFRWRTDPVRVVVHLPCTLRNVTRETDGIRALLQRLPGVEVVTLAPPRNCCGAGGTAMLTQPAMADPLGRETLEALQAPEPGVIISPNVGCSVHLRALQAGGPRIVSPARFLRERLAPALS